MISFLLIAICIISGILFRYFGKLERTDYKSINTWILYIALPAVSLKYLPKINWNYKLIVPLLFPMIMFSIAWVLVNIYKKHTQIDKETESVLKLTAGLSNTSFIGFPLVIAYFGEENLSIAVISDQVTFILLSTIGIITAIKTHEEGSVDLKLVLKKLFTFPPLLGCITALVIPNFVDISFLEPLFDRLASTVGPLALFSVGLQLQISEWKQDIKNISLVVLYKLFFAPFLLLMIALSFHSKGIIPQVSIFEGAMPTLLTASVIASEYKLNAKLCNLIIGITIVIGFISTAIWSVILKYLL